MKNIYIDITNEDFENKYCIIQQVINEFPEYHWGLEVQFSPLFKLGEELPSKELQMLIGVLE
jgi:hypothetical protein